MARLSHLRYLYIVTMALNQLFGLVYGVSARPVSEPRGPESPQTVHPRDASIGHSQASKVVGLLIVVLGSGICFAVFTQRVTAITNWRRVPFIVWLVLVLYASAFIFFLSSALLEFPYDLDHHAAACAATAILCLVDYVFVKNCYFLFLIDRVHIIRGSVCHRLKSKLYIFNLIATVGVYITFNALYFKYKFSSIAQGICVIGLQRVIIIPAITFDVIANVYLTLLFLIPLLRSYSFRRSLWRRPDGNHFITVDRSSSSHMDKRLRKLAIRTFIGACCTTVLTIANLSALLVLDGEPAWMCFMSCRIDILVEVLVIFALTRPESVATPVPRSSTYTSSDRSSAPRKASVAPEQEQRLSQAGPAGLSDLRRAHIPAQEQRADKVEQES